MTASGDTLLLSGPDVRRLLDLDVCIAAVEHAFRVHGLGTAPPPEILGMHAAEGGFHIKAGILEVDGRAYFAAKTNSNFPGNPSRHGLPTIQGVVVLCDARDGRLLALLDSIEITALRTAAATAVAARYLARRDAAVATIVGCGRQGAVQLRALARVRPLRAVFALDQDAAVARAFAARLGAELGTAVTVSRDLEEALAASDLCVTCTPARAPLVSRGMVRAGTFVAGVGADSEDKSELAPDLLAGATVVVDVLAQAERIGDLHHAIAAGAMTRADVRGELGQVVAGRVQGRTGDQEVTVFDSTGMALQDVAAAVAAYRRAAQAGAGSRFGFGGAD